MINNNSFYRKLAIGYIIILCLFVFKNTHAQSFEFKSNQGLISKLIEIKYVSELYLGAAFKQNINKDTALANYNTLRWKLDGFIYQISADMIAANSPRKIILLNKWCLNENINEKKIQVYINIIKEIKNIYEKQILSIIYKNDKTINLTTNVFYLIKDTYTIVNDLIAMKSQKTMAIIELLDHTRLMSPMELAKLGK